MSKSLFSKKAFYIITVITLAFWITTTFIPNSGCEQRRFGPQGVLHWNVCESMTPTINFLYVAFNILTLLGSAYVAVLAIFFLKSES